MLLIKMTIFIPEGTSSRVIFGKNGAIFFAADSVNDSGKMTLKTTMRRPLLNGSERRRKYSENCELLRKNINTLCHGFRLTMQDDYFRVKFDHFKINRCFLRQLGQL